MDNFRVWVDGPFTLTDPVPTGNLPPIATGDVLIVYVDGGHGSGSRSVLKNDVDPESGIDSPLLGVTTVTQPQCGLAIGQTRSVEYEWSGYGFSSDRFYYFVTDGVSLASAAVDVITDALCAQSVAFWPAEVAWGL